MAGKREEGLLAQGWTRQFVASEPRLSEAAELYRSLGYEVRLEPLPPGAEEGECRTCLDVDPERYRIIYTRKSSDQAAPAAEGLFD